MNVGAEVLGLSPAASQSVPKQTPRLEVEEGLIPDTPEGDKVFKLSLTHCATTPAASPDVCWQCYGEKAKAGSRCPHCWTPRLALSTLPSVCTPCSVVCPQMFTCGILGFHGDGWEVEPLGELLGSLRRD